MSSKGYPVKTNHTPWTDIITLIKSQEIPDAEGYETHRETEREISCTFSDGVARGEFYEAAKAGLSLSAQVEIWEMDYEREKLVEYEGDRYKVERSYETGRGTVMLILSEVIR